MLIFGNFRISFRKDAAELGKDNEQFFNLQKFLMFILEYDQTYPEAKTLLEKNRKVRSKKKESGLSKMLGKGFGAALSVGKFLTSNLINMIDLKDKDDGPKTKQKKKIETDEVVADENEEEGALFKQQYILKKVLDNMFDPDNDTIEFDIKIEITKMINHFLDFR